MPIIYTPQSEIFALGIMLLQFYQFDVSYNALTFNPKNITVPIRDPQENELLRFPNTEMRDQTLAFLKQMVDVNPKNRPSLSQCLEFFNTIKVLTLVSKEIQKDIAFFDINEFRHPDMTDTKQSAIIEQLKNADEVWLLDSAAPKKEYDYIEIVGELQKEGVRVGKKLFTQPHADTALVKNEPSSLKIYPRTELIAHLKHHADQQHPQDVLKYTYVSTETGSSKFNDALKQAGVTLSAPGIVIAAAKTLPESDWQKVIDALNKDINRLVQKYVAINPQQKNKTINPVIEKRIKEIAQLRDELINTSNNNHLTIDSITQKLDKLQQNLYSTNVLSNLLNRFAPVRFDTSTSAKAITEVKAELRRPPTGSAY